jgi:hypothetical protein
MRAVVRGPRGILRPALPHRFSTQPPLHQMLNTQRAIPWIGGAGGAAVLVASIIWLSVPSVLLLGFPVHFAEAQWFSLLPDGVGSFVVTDILTAVTAVVCTLVPVGLFFVLSRKVERSPSRAWRYLVASALGLVALSALWYAANWNAGLHYQGTSFVYLNLATSAAALLSMVALAVCWRWWRAPTIPMLFLWLEFAWVLGCAFPWFGETF